MSIIGQAAGAQNAPLSESLKLLLILAPLGLLALALAKRLGVFRRGSIVGPPRVDDSESLGVLFLVMAGGFVMWILVQALCLAPAPANAPAASGPSTAPTTSASQPLVDLSPERMALVTSVPPIVACAFMIGANLALRPNGLRRLGLSLSQLKQGVVSGVIGSCIAVPLVFVAMVLTQMLWEALRYEHPKEHDLLRIMGEAGNPLVAVMLVAAAVVIAPVFEEVLFRGHLQTLVTYGLARLRQWPKRGQMARGFEVIVPGEEQGVYGASALPAEPRPAPTAGMRWVSVIVASLVFSVVHPWWTFPPIFVLAVCLGYAYERTGNLWTTITMHALFNTTSTVIYLAFVH